jgi:hypothetical protein
VVRLGIMNVGVRGMVKEEEEVKGRVLLEERNIDIMVFPETWRGAEMRKRELMGVKKGGNDREDEERMGEEFVWKERCRRRGNRGGVGIAIRKEMGEVEVVSRYSCDNVICVRIDMANSEQVWVMGVYLTPAGKYEIEYEEGMSMITLMLEEKRGENIIIMGDVNGKIGEISNCEKKDGGGVEWTKRSSEDKKSDRRGVDIKNIVEKYKMVIMNGIGGGNSGRITCRGEEGGGSVVDWIMMSKGVAEDSGVLDVENGWFEEGGRSTGDHRMVTVEWTAGTNDSTKTTSTKVSKGNEMVDIEEKKRCNTRRGWKDGWERVEKESDIRMKEWCERNASKEIGIEEMNETWREVSERVIDKTIGWIKTKKGGKKKRWYDKKITELNKQMKEIMIEWMKETNEEGKEEWKKKKKDIRRRKQIEVRRLRNKRKKEIMKEVEEVIGRERNCLMKRLKKIEGKEIITMGGDRKIMKDKDNVEYEGEELREKWRYTFEQIGKMIEEKGGYDEELKMKVEEDMEDVQEDDRMGVGLDEEITRKEINHAINRLKNGKASGVDGVVAEIIKHGGDWMNESLWQLCSAVFDREQVPSTWMKAVKVPLKKKGSGKYFEDYRGITLLSVVGKVFGIVIETRLREYCESAGILVDNQFGFRKGRASRDALYVLSEIVNRKDRVNYVAFIDISKAYPSVWRDGLWWKLKKAGITGKMLAILKSMYSRSKVGVRVGGIVRDDEWYDDFVGLREGCIVSPLLFAIFINDLAKELDEIGVGIDVGRLRLACLMFADDIVIFARTPEGLQKALEVAGKYSRKWRYEYNFGVDKSEIVVFGSDKDKREWTLNGVVVRVVDTYKYLGVRFISSRRGNRWRENRNKIIVKANRALYRAWGVGMKNKELSVRGGKRLFETLVRPVLEYGAEIDSGGWPQAEIVLNRAGRMCFGVGNEVANEVIRGDLGWWTVQGRREYQRLNYWAKVVNEEKSDIVKEVYREGRERIRTGIAKSDEWCMEIKGLLEKLGLKESWESEQIGDRDEWRIMLKKAMQNRQECEWRSKMCMEKRGAKTSLMRYMRIKNSIVPEWYLGENRVWARRWLRIRGGRNGLQVDKGRRGGVERINRTCVWCDQKVVEDAEHMMDECDGWNDERDDLWDKMMHEDIDTMSYISSWSRRDKTDWLIRGGNKKTRLVILKNITSWFYRREKKVSIDKKLI